MSSLRCWIILLICFLIPYQVNADGNECNNFILNVHNAASSNRYISYSLPEYAALNHVTTGNDILVEPGKTILVTTVINPGSPYGFMNSGWGMAYEDTFVKISVKDENKNSIASDAIIKKSKASIGFSLSGCMMSPAGCYYWTDPAGNFVLENFNILKIMESNIGSCENNKAGTYTVITL